MEIIDYDFTIPSLLLHIDGVTKTDLKLYQLVKSLARQKGYCYATNAYIGQIIGMNERNVQKYLGRLKKLGLIDCEVIRAGVQSSRKIFMLDDSRKRHKIYQNQNLNKHVPNGTPGGVPNETGGDVPNGTPRLEEYKTKTIIQQQDAQAREAAAVVFFKDMNELLISDEDIIAIDKEFSKEEIANAIEYVKHKMSLGKCDNPGGMLVSCLREKWKLPPKEPAPPPPQEDAQAKRQQEAKATYEENKEFHKQLIVTHKLKEGHSEQLILGDIVITLPNGAKQTLNYEFAWFQQLLKKYYELK